MENETTTIWNKKTSDLTVSDSLKVSAATAAVGVVAPLVIMAAIGGVVGALEKIRNSKKVELEVVKTEV
jgi:hypothetical protein